MEEATQSTLGLALPHPFPYAVRAGVIGGQKSSRLSEEAAETPSRYPSARSAFG
jgi:hypothetical protein